MAPSPDRQQLPRVPPSTRSPRLTGLRRTRSTPTAYRLLSMLAAGALVAAAAIATWAAKALDDRTDRIRNETAPVLVTTQELFSSLAEANASATAVHLSGRDEDRELRRNYEVALERSTQQLEQIAALIGDNAEAHNALQSIGAKLSRYAGLIESARTGLRTGSAAVDANATLTTALELMRTGISRDVQVLTDVTRARLDDDYGRPIVQVLLAVTVLLIALVLLIVLQRFMKARAHRLINPLVLLATISVVVAVVWLTFAERNQRADLSAGRELGFNSIALTGQIQTTAYQAKAEESLALIAGTSGADAFATFEKSAATLAPRNFDAATFTAAREGTTDGAGLLLQASSAADNQRERAAVAEVLQRWQRYRDTNREIQQAALSGNRTQASSVALQSGNRAFTGFNLAVESLLRDNKAEFAGELDRAHDRLRLLLIGMLILPLLALALMLWGTQQRINEYR